MNKNVKLIFEDGNEMNVLYGTCVREVIKDFALITEPKDAEKFAYFIDMLFFNDSLCKKMSSEGIIHARKFSWEETANKTVKVYEEMKSL